VRKTELDLLRDDAKDLARTLFRVRQRQDYRRWANYDLNDLMDKIEARLQNGEMLQLSADIEDILTIPEIV
jgi:hypothetical protein